MLRRDVRGIRVERRAHVTARDEEPVERSRLAGREAHDVAGHSFDDAKPLAVGGDVRLQHGRAVGAGDEAVRPCRPSRRRPTTTRPSSRRGRRRRRRRSRRSLRARRAPAGSPRCPCTTSSGSRRGACDRPSSADRSRSTRCRRDRRASLPMLCAITARTAPVGRASHAPSMCTGPSAAAVHVGRGGRAGRDAKRQADRPARSCPSRRARGRTRARSST